MHPRIPPEALLEWRVRFMGAGALMALVGMYFEASWLVWVAIAVLAAGFALRFAAKHDEDGSDDDAPPDEDDEEA
jgi:hypothetical protein